MEKFSQDDQRELLRVIESEDELTVEKADVGGRDGEETDTDRNFCMKDGKPDITSRQEEFTTLEIKSNPGHLLKSDIEIQETRELLKCADDKLKKEIVEKKQKLIIVFVIMT